jgi:cobalt-zinc-cadmium efflux system membrane fusion protein
MNKLVSIAIFIGLVLFADRRIFAAKPLVFLSAMAAKAPTPDDRVKDEDDDPGSKKSTIAEPSPTPIDQGQTENKPNDTKENVREEPRSSPSDQDRTENGDKKSNDQDVKNSNEMGRVELDAKKIENAHLEVEVAGPAKIKTVLRLYGKIAMNDDAVANVSPRFPGLVKSVSVRLGDRVEKGQVLAVVESNDSLRNYQVTSEIAGTIIKKEITIGEVVRDDKPIFTVADLSTVWIDFSVFPQDFERVKRGQIVRITYAANVEPITGEISYIAPVGSENTQSLLARAVAANSEGALRPGLFVMGELEADDVEVPVAVRPSAIQSLNEKTVVFVVAGSAFEARAVQLGPQDDSNVQVVSGLNAGDRYVAANSFLLKAELAKGEAGGQD